MLDSEMLEPLHQPVPVDNIVEGLSNEEIEEPTLDSIREAIQRLENSAEYLNRAIQNRFTNEKA